MLEILYKSKSAVAVVKPAGVPSQSDASGDKDITRDRFTLASTEGCFTDRSNHGIIEA